MQLTGQQREKLQAAFIESFPSYRDLELMLSFGLNEDLNRVAPDTENLRVVTHRLIRWAESRDSVDQLVVAARRSNPWNLILRLVAEGLDLASAPPKDSYERIVVPAAGFQNPGKFREQMSLAELTICRVEVPGRIGIGTAFLVGSNIVITNQHVREEWIRRNCKDEQIVMRFDYRRKKDGIDVYEGRECKLEKDWLVASSPVLEFDYILMRLDEAAGNDSLGGGPNAKSRGYLTPREHSFSINEPLMILQHPAARPLELGIGAVKGEVPIERVEHNVNTEGGSSGSPCFTVDWKVVALHHWGTDSVNRAVKFSAILKNLEEKKVRGQLG